MAVRARSKERPAMGRPEGKTAVVTSGTRGIGLAGSLPLAEFPTRQRSLHRDWLSQGGNHKRKLRIFLVLRT
jgi:hypothetical protein